MSSEFSIKINRVIIKTFKDLDIDIKKFKSLDELNDWSFIVQLHVYMEEFCKNSLISLFNNSVRTLLQEDFSNIDFSSFIEHLSMGDKKTGYISLLTDTELLPKRNKKFLKQLGEIRNKFAHNHTHLNSSIKEYYEKLNPNSQKNFHHIIDVRQEVNHKEIITGDSKTCRKMILRSAFLIIIELCHFIRFHSASTKLLDRVKKT